MKRFAFLLLLMGTATAAERPNTTTVPPPLAPWTDWVMRGHENLVCADFLGTPREESVAQADAGPSSVAPVAPGCIWPSRLSLVLDGHSGHFTQEWHVSRDASVPLPGDKTRWPQDVKVDGKPATTLADDDAPTVQLLAGSHVVTGTLAWEQLPESLHIPPATGLLSLTLDGQAVATPSRDATGLLWLHRATTEKEEESRLDVTVYRKVVDAIPMLMTTRVRLEVSGKSREVLLGKALLDGFIPLSVMSELPARVEDDGRVRVQVRPGTWLIDVESRHADPVSELRLTRSEGPWSKDEAWVFDARPDLRVVDVLGVPSVDPQQTTLPPDWRQFPAYRVTPGETMKFTERRRGDAQPGPDQLTLQRTLWLDFSGRGYTARDHIGGTLTRSWRLSASPSSDLGRVAVDGQPQLVTRLSPDGAAGVEIRTGAVNVEADSRLEGRVDALSATGWNADFSQVNATLQLPPGWRLIHASGVDDVPGTWIRQWSLLDLFLALIIAVAVLRLFGPLWGVIALIGLGLAFNETGVPQWTWLFPLAFEALVRVLPPSRLSSLLQTARLTSWVVLAIVLISFAAGHIRRGLYPVLESEEGGGGEVRDLFAASNAAVSGAASVVSRAEAPPEGKARLGWDSGAYQQQLDYRQIDPTAVVQTGPGVPQWTWSSYALRWSGPVESSQQIHLFLLNPTVNMLLAFLRVALLAALCLRLLKPGRGRAIPVTVPAAIVFVALLGGNARAADFPPQPMLDSLENRLIQPPECAPNCASSPRMLLEATADSLTLRMEINTGSHVAVPLPGGLSHWSPERVLLDGQPAKALQRGSDGALWIELTPGPHQVMVTGALPARESIQLPLPLKPRRVESKLEGWTLDGVQESGTPDASLQLTRARHDGAGAGVRTFEPGALPPFVRVERALLLGLDWQVQTKIVRVSPEGGPILLSIPLVAGESVTTADIHVEGGKALINMAPQTSEVSWRSVLKPTDKIELEASHNPSWTEVWRLEASPVWHVDLSGIPPIHLDPKGARIPEWRPWPGEKVAVAVTRPQSVAGQTLTIESSNLEVTPGLRSTDGHLSLSISSSRGGQYTLMLPHGATLQSLSVDEHALPVQQEGDKVLVPLHPGTQKADLAWRESSGIAFLFHTPHVDLGQPSVNNTTTVKLSSDRWVLLTRGPPIGPAVLFWGMLVVLIGVAFGLARARLAPLRVHHWILLAIGLTQVPLVVAAVVPAWLLLLGWRRERGARLKEPWQFDLLQLALAGLTLVALGVLFASIHEGLLGVPDMQVQGNHSTASSLQWFQDRMSSTLPVATAVSLPLIVYRVVMLLWALWLAFALVRWLRWSWESFTAGGYWKPLSTPRPPVAPKPPPPPAPKPSTT